MTGVVVEEIVFLGTGTSSQVPTVHCLTADRPSCTTCVRSMQPGDRNRRRNTSLALRIRPDHGADRLSTILIDCGKSFYEAAIAVFPECKIRSIEGIILTHEHADAVLGLDDLRDFTLHGQVQSHIDVYLTKTTQKTVQATFPYLVDASLSTGSGLVSDLRFHVFDEHTPLTVADLELLPLPVPHGRGCTNLGFRFQNVAYIADCEAVPDDIVEKIKNIDLLILDSLKFEADVKSHLSYGQSLDVAKRVNAKRTLFTGMCHLMEHYATNERLREHEKATGQWIRLAHDGQRVRLADVVSGAGDALGRAGDTNDQD